MFKSLKSIVSGGDRPKEKYSLEMLQSVPPSPAARVLTPRPPIHAAPQSPRCRPKPPARRRYLVGQLNKMPTLTEDDVEHKEEVVESLRMMAELIIWGDQNNSSVLECAPASPRARPPPATPPSPARGGLGAATAWRTTCWSSSSPT